MVSQVQTDTPAKVIITCSVCAANREVTIAKKTGGPRTPRGWKLLAGIIYCPKCTEATYALRAVSLPIAACDWDVIRPLLRAAWADTRRCSNWLLTQYYQSDTLAQPSDTLPKWEIPYMYPAARRAYPQLEPTATVSIINAISSKYKATRFDMWRGAASLPVYRSSPLPINAQAWKLTHDMDKNEWFFSFRYLSVWHTLVLRRDVKFRRQHTALRQVISGDAEAGEAALYESGKEIMLKIAARFKRGVMYEARGTVKARTAADAFLIAANGERTWRINADHVQRWIVGAQAQQQRLREDLKAERRFPRRMRQGIIERMAFTTKRRSDRLDSWMHEASAQLVNWVKRQHAAQLIWDDTYRSMFPAYPWFIFSQRIEDKCKMAGIEFVHASEGVTLESQEALAKNG